MIIFFQMMGHRALLFALFTAVAVNLCSTALTAENAVDCAKHFNSIYRVNKSKKIQNNISLLYSISQYNFHDMTETGGVARRKSWLIRTQKVT